MTHNDNSASNAGGSKEHPGFWALLGLVACIAFGGRTLSALLAGEVKIPFAANLLRAEHPMAFYGVILLLSVFTAMALVGVYLNAREWQAKRRPAKR